MKIRRFVILAMTVLAGAGLASRVNAQGTRPPGLRDCEILGTCPGSATPTAHGYAAIAVGRHANGVPDSCGAFNYGTPADAATAAKNTCQSQQILNAEVVSIYNEDSVGAVVLFGNQYAIGHGLDVGRATSDARQNARGLGATPGTPLAFLWVRSSARPIEAQFGSATFGRWNEVLDTQAVNPAVPRVLGVYFLNPVIAGRPAQVMRIAFHDPSRQTNVAELRPLNAPGMPTQRVRFSFGQATPDLSLNFQAGCSVPNATYTLQFILYDQYGRAAAVQNFSYLCQAG